SARACEELLKRQVWRAAAGASPQAAAGRSVLGAVVRGRRLCGQGPAGHLAHAVGAETGGVVPDHGQPGRRWERGEGELAHRASTCSARTCSSAWVNTSGRWAPETPYLPPMT